MSTRFLVAIAATITLAACHNGATTRPAARPHHTAAYIEPKTPASPTVASQPGFENDLPSPDPGITGQGTAYESDLGEPRWRNNPGGYDDGTRPKRTETPSNQNAIQNKRSLPPTTSVTEP
jgi:hypothetical protein